MVSSASEVIVLAAPRAVVSFELDCGLECCLVSYPEAPIVATALAYRVGSRDEAPAQAGIAHFLEHLMFKGSLRFGPGEIDRLTQKLGGANNAFTSRDLTVYHFEFARQEWSHALAIEADRMATLELGADAIEVERAVIADEIAMISEDPWEALSEEVEATYFGDHPYGRPVIGYERTLKSLRGPSLRDFYQRFYRPSNAVLVVSGAVGEEDRELVERSFAALSRLPPPQREPMPELTEPPPTRIERKGGDVPRLLLAFPAPPPRGEDAAGLAALSLLLATGRSGRLTRNLVEEKNLCTWISVDLFEGSEAGMLTIAAEAAPGVAPERMERMVLDELARAAEAPIRPSELERVRSQLLLDWAFAHERSGQRAVAAAVAMASFDLDFPHRQLLAALDYGEDRLGRLARELLRPDAVSVVAWSLP